MDRLKPRAEKKSVMTLYTDNDRMELDNRTKVTFVKPDPSILKAEDQIPQLYPTIAM